MFKYPALFLSFGITAWLLLRDSRRRSSALSAALWIPTVLLLVISSRPLSLWLGAAGGEGEPSVADQLFYFLMLAGSFTIASLRGIRWSRVFGGNLPLMILYLFFAVSVLWSGDPIGSSKRLFKDFGLLFVIAVIVTEKDPLEAIRAVYFRCASVLFPLSVVFIKYFPTYSRSFSMDGTPTYTGVTTQKNTLGEIVLVFTLFLAWDYLESRSQNTPRFHAQWDRVALFAMAGWLLYMSKSKTALLCLVIGTLLLRRVRRGTGRILRKSVFIGALSLPYLMFFTQRFSNIVAPLVEAMGRNMTFTGRADIWAHIDLKTVDPVLGAGYWNFWGGRSGHVIADAMNTVVPNAHCGYLDIYLDGGVVALILLFIVLIAYGRRVLGSPMISRFQDVRFAILIVMIVYNLSESMYFRLSPIWFTTLLCLVHYPAMRSQRRMAPQANHIRTPEQQLDTQTALTPQTL